MNLSQMLFSKVTPLSEYEPMREHKKKPVKLNYEVPKNNRWKHDLTIEKYRSVWKDDDVWLTNKEIEARLGMTKAGAANTLKKWLEEYKIIERRPVGGKTYNPSIGYEWKWK